MHQAKKKVLFSFLSISGKIYCYLYDTNKHKKYRLDANTEKQMYQYRLVGW